MTAGSEKAPMSDTLRELLDDARQPGGPMSRVPQPRPSPSPNAAEELARLLDATGECPDAAALIRKLAEREGRLIRAIEHGQYLVTAIDGYLRASTNPEPHQDDIADAYSALRSAVYEFTKRAALQPPAEEGKG